MGRKLGRGCVLGGHLGEEGVEGSHAPLFEALSASIILIILDLLLAINVGNNQFSKPPIVGKGEIPTV